MVKLYINCCSWLSIYMVDNLKVACKSIMNDDLDNKLQTRSKFKHWLINIVVGSDRDAVRKTGTCDFCPGSRPCSTAHKRQARTQRSGWRPRTTCKNHNRTRRWWWRDCGSGGIEWPPGAGKTFRASTPSLGSGGRLAGWWRSYCSEEQRAAWQAGRSLGLAAAEEPSSGLVAGRLAEAGLVDAGT